MKERPESPRRRQKKAGAPVGFIVPARLPLEPLGDKERSSLVAAIGNPTSEGVVDAVSLAVLTLIRGELTEANRPSEREVAAALVDIASDAVAFADQFPLKNLHVSSVSTAVDAAWTELLLDEVAYQKWRDALLALNNFTRQVASHALKHEERARRQAGRPNIHLLSMLASIHNALDASGVRTSLPGSEYLPAQLDEELSPYFRTSVVALRLAHARLVDAERENLNGSKEARQRVEAELLQRPRTFLHKLTTAKAHIRLQIQAKNAGGLQPIK